MVKGEEGGRVRLREGVGGGRNGGKEELSLSADRSWRYREMLSLVERDQVRSMLGIDKNKEGSEGRRGEV